MTHDIDEALKLGDRVIVMLPPGRVYQEMIVGIPKPRDIASLEFEAAKRRLLKLLDSTLARH